MKKLKIQNKALVDLILKIEDLMELVNETNRQIKEDVTVPLPTVEEYKSAPEPVVDAEVLATPTPSKPVAAKSESAFPIFAGLKLKPTND